MPRRNALRNVREPAVKNLMYNIKMMREEFFRKYKRPTENKKPKENKRLINS